MVTNHAAEKKSHTPHPRASHAKAAHHTNRNATLLAIQDRAADVVSGLTDQLTDLKEKGMQSSQALENVVIENPKSSLLIAFGVGYVLARLRRWM